MSETETTDTDTTVSKESLEEQLYLDVEDRLATAVEAGLHPTEAAEVVIDVGEMTRLQWAHEAGKQDIELFADSAVSEVTEDE